MTRYPPWDPKARLRICGGGDCPYSNADDGGHAPGFGESGRCSWCGEGYEADPVIPVMVDDRQPPGIVSVIARGEKVTQVRSFALAPEEPAPEPHAEA